MKLSLHATTIVGTIFAAICLSVAIPGFLSLGDIQDPVDLEVTSSSGNVWPLRLRRRPDGTLDVTLHNVK